MALPPPHAAFLANPKAAPTSPAPDPLLLQVRRGRPAEAAGWRPLYAPSDTWEMWQDGAGRYVWNAPPQSPPRRHLIVDPRFTSGEVIGEFSPDQAVYPLEDLDMVLWVNWLAEFGDLILHAAGVALDGRGYAFAGPGGAGKSTLSAELGRATGATILGEDQVILRYLEGRFCIFGTPWHMDPACCSPLGVPLERLFFLDRAGVEGIGPCPPLDGVARLLQTAFVPYYRPAAVAAIVERLALLAESVPFSTLGYRLGTDLTTLLRPG